MSSSRPEATWSQSSFGWLALGCVAPLGMLLACGLMLADLRKDAWDKVEQTSRNLLQVIERDISRNFEIYDLSIRAVVDNLKRPGVLLADPELRQLILFDRAATARDMGVLLVLDENGDVVHELGAMSPRRVNYGDREYFQAHKADPGLGLHVGRPVVARVSQRKMVPLSRRVNKPDGSFGGIVVGTWQLSYFTRLFHRLDFGRQGAVNLFLLDGTRIVREPSADDDIGANIAGAQTFARFKSEESGSFVHESARDGVTRYFAFTRVGDLPLILNVAIAVEDVENEWRKKALTIGGLVALLCALAIGLAVVLIRELRGRASMEREIRRANAELSRLSLTDALTGLPNRRRFDEALAQAWLEGRRSGKPFSLLIVDVDHFKRVNDRYGHQVGDAVLAGLARCLSGSIHRPSDLTCRLGGEEFGLVLPETEAEGAIQVADRIHAAVAAMSIASAGIGPGEITVSIGAADSRRWAARDLDATGVYRLADEALYDAKAKGRNRTAFADSSVPIASSRPALRLVEEGRAPPNAARA